MDSGRKSAFYFALMLYSGYLMTVERLQPGIAAVFLSFFVPIENSFIKCNILHIIRNIYIMF